MTHPYALAERDSAARVAEIEAQRDAALEQDQAHAPGAGAVLLAQLGEAASGRVGLLQRAAQGVPVVLGESLVPLEVCHKVNVADDVRPAPVARRRS